jgi:hypothetical protein
MERGNGCRHAESGTVEGAEPRAFEDVEEMRQNQSLPMQGLRSLQGVDTNSNLRI